MKNNEKLTGRRRYRSHRLLGGRDVLVLQVEVKFDNGPDDRFGLPIYHAGTEWRDAEVADISVESMA